MVIKVRICCPVVFYEEINAVSKRKITPKWQSPKFFRFLTFLCNFCQIFDRLDWNVEKSEQGTSSLSGRLFEELIAVFKLKNISNRHRNGQKTQVFQFWKFLCNFCQISIDFWDWNVENGHQSKNLFDSKTNDSKCVEKSKKFIISFLCNLYVLFESFWSQNVSKRSTMIVNS